MLYFKIILTTAATLLTLFFWSPLTAKNTLPVEAFSRLPDVSGVTLSPDGDQIASLVRVDTEELKGVILSVLNFTTNSNKIVLSNDNSKYVIGWIEWANNNTLLVSTYYPAKLYNTPVTATRLLRIDITSGKVTSAIPKRLISRAKYVPVVQDNVIDFLPDNPDEILVSLRTSNDVATEVYRINHKKETYKRIQGSRANTLDWVTDQQNNVRLAYRFKGTRVKYAHRADHKSSWNSLFEYEVFDENARSPLGFDFNPDILYYIGLHKGFDAIFKVDVSAQELNPTLVYSEPNQDIRGSLIYSDKSKKVVGIRYDLGDGFVFWDSDFDTIQKSINKALPKTRNKIIGFSRDERRMLILSTNDKNAGTYYYWNRDAKTMDGIAQRYKQLNPDLMVEKKAINYAARDGLNISGYLTLGSPATDKPLPTIIFPHGGPISYDGKGFDYWTQYFASKGYNVLQMNFRGSSGYGHDFMASGLGDWGGKMQTDIEDGTRWLIKQGIAEPTKICIVGASYGGYAALMEAANDSGLYQCAVSFAGVTDLVDLLFKSRRYINYKVVKKQIGSQRKKLKHTSPTFRASEINIPILLVHGSEDRVVPIAQGRRMHKKLQKAKKNVEYIELEDGNHFLSNEEHRVSFFKAMDAFLSRHLDP